MHEKKKKIIYCQKLVRAFMYGDMVWDRLGVKEPYVYTTSLT